MLISSSSLARSICLGPSAGRPTQATSRASQPARLPRTAGHRRWTRPMFQMPPRSGGDGVPAPQAPPPTALPRRRVVRSRILRGPTRTCDPAMPGRASGLGWRFRPWLTSSGTLRPSPKGPLRFAFVAAGERTAACSKGGVEHTMYHVFMKRSSGILNQGSQSSVRPHGSDRRPDSFLARPVPLRRPQPSSCSTDQLHLSDESRPSTLGRPPPTSSPTSSRSARGRRYPRSVFEPSAGVRRTGHPGEALTASSPRLRHNVPRTQRGSAQ